MIQGSPAFLLRRSCSLRRIGPPILKGCFFVISSNSTELHTKSIHVIPVSAALTVVHAVVDVSKSLKGDRLVACIIIVASSTILAVRPTCKSSVKFIDLGCLLG